MKTNTELCVDIKTKLQKDARMKHGKWYEGIIKRESHRDQFGLDDDLFTFIETLPTKSSKRNPRVFSGKYVTMTRHDDGTYRPSLKVKRVGHGFRTMSYAFGVAFELLDAFASLVEKEGRKE